MNIEQMRDAFAAKDTVSYDIFGRLREDDEPVHFEISFIGPGKVSKSLVDDRELPELAAEAWSLIERHGSDESLEAFLSGFLVAFAAPVGVPA